MDGISEVVLQQSERGTEGDSPQKSVRCDQALRDVGPSLRRLVHVLVYARTDSTRFYSLWSLVVLEVTGKRLMVGLMIK